MWEKGIYRGLNYVAKIFDIPSPSGINNGRISKLQVNDNDGRIILKYDRGWDVKPSNEKSNHWINSFIKWIDERICEV